MPAQFNRRRFLRVFASLPVLGSWPGTAPSKAADGRVNIAAIRKMGGKPGDGVTHDDPVFPGANGRFSWMESDPLGRGDNGGTVIAAAGPNGGWWVRDDLPDQLSPNHRLKLDWWEMEDEKDIAPILLDWARSYAAIYADLSEDARRLVCDRLDASRQQVHTLHLYEPSHPLTIRSGAWRWGRVDLTTANWTRNESGLNDNEWSVSVSESAVSNFFLAHPSNGAPRRNSNPARGAWLMDAGTPRRRVQALRGIPDWTFDKKARRIRIFSGSDPRTFFSELRYTTVYPDFIMKWVGVVDRYIGGPKHNVTFAGRKFRQPMSSENTRSGERGGLGTAIEFRVPKLSPPRGRYEWHANLDNLFGNGLLDTGSAGERIGIKKSIVSGTFIEAPVFAYSPVHLHWDDATFVNQFYCGPGWTGQISTSGTGYGARTENLSRWYGSRRSYGPRAIYVEKSTGRTIGGSAFPFAGATFAGNGVDDPLVAEISDANYTVHAVDATPNGRPVFIDNQNSAANLLGKADGLGTRRPGYFVKIVDRGVRDEKGRFRRVDIRQSPKRNELNVTSDPTRTRLYMPDRPGLFSIEATSENPHRTYFQDFIHLQIEGIGTAPINLGTVEERHPADFTGFHTLLGDGESEIRNPIRIWDNCLVDNIRQARGYQEFGILMRPYNHYLARNNTVRNCVFGDGSNVRIGLGAVNTRLEALEFKGKARKVIAVDAEDRRNFRRDQPVDIRLDKVRAPAGSTIDVVDPKKQDRANLFIQVGGAWWQAPYVFGGQNRSGPPPPVLKRMGYAHFPIGWSGRGQAPRTKENLAMPARIAKGDLMLLWLALDRDPGRVRLPRGWTLREHAKLSDGSLYCALYWKISDGTDWRYGNFRVPVGWDHRCVGWSKIVHLVGQAETPIGNSAIAVRASGSKMSSPPVTTTADGSLVLAFGATPGNALVRSFEGANGDWTATVSKRSNKPTFGWSMQNYYRYKTGGSIFAAEQRIRNKGTVAACDMILNTEMAAGIAMGLEIRTK